MTAGLPMNAGFQPGDCMEDPLLRLRPIAEIVRPRVMD